MTDKSPFELSQSFFPWSANFHVFNRCRRSLSPLEPFLYLENTCEQTSEVSYPEKALDFISICIIDL